MAKKTQKTHKGTKKVLNVRQSGSISVGKPGFRHNTGSKNTNYNRKARKGSALSKADNNRLKRIIDTL
jgi:ribosomal protein L35